MMKNYWRDFLPITLKAVSLNAINYRDPNVKKFLEATYFQEELKVI